ncbi:major facilitator superfamily domain-containing protein [Hyaloraphidium curvatum]|nr:major facilitator superfamily domain-containing protein [Hyaloraphidium curvatum]
MASEPGAVELAGVPPLAADADVGTAAASDGESSRGTTERASADLPQAESEKLPGEHLGHGIPKEGTGSEKVPGEHTGDGIDGAESKKLPVDHVGDGMGKDETAVVVEEAPVAPVTPAPTDKSLKAWLVVFACFSAHVWGIGYPAIWGLFQRTLLLDNAFNGATNFQLAFVGTIVFATMVVVGPFAGSLADILPIKIMAMSGTAVMATGILLGSFCTELWQLFLTQALFGLGGSFVMMPATSVTPTWFTKWRSLAMGIAVSGTGIGGFILSGVTQACISAGGWRLAMRVLAGMCLGWMGLATLGLQRRFPPQKRKGSFLTLVYFKNTTFTLLFTAVLLIMFSFFTPQIFIPLMLNDGGYSQATGAGVVAAFSAMVAAGRICGGFLADRIGEINMFCAGCLVPFFAVLCIWMPAPTQLGTTVTASIFIAFFCGAPLVTMPVLSAIEFGTANLGSVLGILYLSFGPGEIVGPSLSGLIVDSTTVVVNGQRVGANYRPLLGFVASTWFLGAVFIIALRYKKVGWKLKVRI